MSRASKVSYDQWIEHLFREFASCSSQSDQMDVSYPHAWNSNPRMLVEHYTSFLNDPVPVVVKHGKDAVGDVLWSLVSGLHGVFVDVCHPKIPREFRDRAILSMSTLMQRLASEHLTHGLWNTWNKLDTAVFMYWDIAAIWPPKGTDEGKSFLEVCLSEMKLALKIDHPVAQLHSLHGLGELYGHSPDQIAPIVDAWIASHPYANPEIIEYAQHARDGRVQ